MSEEQFRQQIRAIALMYGWSMQYHTYMSKRSDAGWPDEVLCNPARRRIIFVELKSDKGRLSPAQREWLNALHTCGMETALWRPSNIPVAVQVLGPKQRKTSWLDQLDTKQ